MLRKPTRLLDGLCSWNLHPGHGTLSRSSEEGSSKNCRSARRSTSRILWRKFHPLCRCCYDGGFKVETGNTHWYVRTSWILFTDYYMPGVAHRVTRDDEYNGYHIPAQSIVIGNSWWEGWLTGECNSIKASQGCPAWSWYVRARYRRIQPGEIFDRGRETQSRRRNAWSCIWIRSESMSRTKYGWGFCLVGDGLYLGVLWPWNASG